jgi:hypothetical protein
MGGNFFLGISRAITGPRRRNGEFACIMRQTGHLRVVQIGSRVVADPGDGKRFMCGANTREIAHQT